MSLLSGLKSKTLNITPISICEQYDNNILSQARATFHLVHHLVLIKNNTILLAKRIFEFFLKLPRHKPKT